MKAQMCLCCGSNFYVGDYTLDELRQTITLVARRWGHKKTLDEIVQYLAAQGFKMSDVRTQMTRLWDEGVIELTPGSCRINESRSL